MGWEKVTDPNEMKAAMAGMQQPNGRASAAQYKQGIINKGQLSDLTAVEQQLGRTKDLYNKNFKGVGPGSILEYLPTPKRKQFDRANDMLSMMMKPLIRGPNEGAWTDADQVRLDKMSLSGGNQDKENEEGIRSIELLLKQRKAKHSQPESGWKVTRIK